MARPIRCWHFLPEDMRGGYGSEPPWHDGETREVEGPPRMCAYGYHGSRCIIDALAYTRGPIICRVDIDGDVLTDTDKIVGRRRKLLWHLGTASSERILHEFACWCAERALRRERRADREPDERSWGAIEAKRQWLLGEITNEELAAASDAARAAASDAARAAASDAARAAQERKLLRMIMAARRR